ncbi:TPA: hypothetical protein ACVOYQ_001293 [Vibrio alginolyticus]
MNIEKLLLLTLLVSGATQAATDLILECKDLSNTQTVSSPTYLIDFDKDVADVLFDTTKQSLLLQVEDQFYRISGQLDVEYGSEKVIDI